MNQKLVKKYRRLKKIGWVDAPVLIVAMALSILSGIFGLCFAKTVSMRVLFCFVLVGVPILEIFAYAKFEKYCAAVELKFKQMVKDNIMTADDVLKLGKEMGIDLFNLAVEVRCIKELGLEGVPEWCARDGVLPTADQIS